MRIGNELRQKKIALRLCRRGEELGRPMVKGGKPATCDKCKMVEKNFVMILLESEPAEIHATICDDCYHAEMAKPVREWGVQT